MNDWIEIGALTTSRAWARAWCASAAATSPCSAPATTQVFALRDRCPHKGGPLSQGIVYGTSVACPLHDWVIDLDTGLAVAPDEGCAARFPVRVESGKVFLS